MTPNQVIVSDTNKTPIVQIITWLALATSVFAFFVHAGLKLYISESLSLEIFAGFCALVFCAAQSLAVSFQCANGFGKPLDTLSSATVQSQFQAEYAATMLFILAMCFSKLVIVLFIRTLSPKVAHHRINMVLGGTAVMWTIGSIFSIAFECGATRPWDKLSGKCFNRLNWWYGVSALNIVTEVGLTGLEFAIAYELQLKRKRKATIISIFLCRTFVSIAIILHLVFLRRDYTGPGRGDLSLGYWRSAVCQQAVQSLAIVTTSLPYAKMFMVGLDSGMIRIDDTRRRGENYSNESSGRAYELLGRSKDSTRRLQAARVEAETSDSDHTPNTGINQTKTWTVERERGEISHKEVLGLPIDDFDQRSGSRSH